MERKSSAVKKRSYDSSLRRERAHATRVAILEAARARFLRDGVSATTIASIASAANVSPDTIYKAFGGKPGLVRAIAERGLAGEGPVHAEQRSDALQRSERDPREIMRGFGRLSTEVAPRVAPIILMVREAAAVDSAMAELWDELEAQRLTRMMHNARTLLRAGHLRDGITVKQAAEVMWAYTSPELYERLVLKRRWKLERFGAFVADGLAASLLS